MKENVVVAGGGIGGMASALALARSGSVVQLVEQAEAFGEVGAGIQLGPNAVRVLQDWGLTEVLNACAAFPEELQVRDAHGGHRIGRMRLGPLFRARYGQAYATIHRADLLAMLHDAVRQRPEVRLTLGTRVASYEALPGEVRVHAENDAEFRGEALIGADGLWSRVRHQLLGAQPVRASGHLAYRGMIAARDVPALSRANAVTAWLGPRLHVVHYPVRRGEWFNIVAVVHGVLGQGHGGPPGSDPQAWSHEARDADLRRALGPVCFELMDMLRSVQDWKLWALNDRPPMTGVQDQARGRVALLGDAAHPLRPYLAQGAAMALEDAWTLGRLRSVAEAPGGVVDWPTLLARYAQVRWARNARVQARSTRNGSIFHAVGPVRLARNLAMAALGESVMDNRWLYSGPPDPLA